MRTWESRLTTHISEHVYCLWDYKYNKVIYSINVVFNKDYSYKDRMERENKKIVGDEEQENS